MRLLAPEAAAGHAERLPGRGVGHRLSRRLDRLSRAARRRLDPARLARQRSRAVEPPIAWERARPPLLRARRGDRADGIEPVLAALRRRAGRALVVGPPYLWLLVFFLVPFAIVAEDQHVGPGDGAAALHAGAQLARRLRRMARVPPRARLREFRDAVGRRPLLAGGPRLAAHRARLDGAPAPYRLPDGLRHGSRPGRRAPHPRRARDPAVLDELPDPRLCLDRHPQARGAAEPPAHRPRAHLGAAVDPQHRRRRSISASSTPICPSWCCRSTPRSSGSTRR